ncbi:MAG TPA: protein-disulfide reductase DsbD [Chromatiales bacterium]|nr:protein-disulfide reductase DsbD [Chromatiales bacterium]
MLNRLIPALFILLLTQPLSAFLSDDDLLPADEAFSPSIKLVEPGILEATWKIADGYYLYRDKFKFSTDTPGITLQEAKLPRGKIKQDEFFGQIETLRHEVTARIPYQGNAASLDLLTGYQGCADIGVCYPPQKKTLTLQLATANTAPPASKSFDILGGLRNDLGLGGEPELLPADEAFAFNAQIIDGNLEATWQIAENYHLYKDKIKLDIPGVTLGQPDFPPPDFIEDDPELGKLESYRGLLTLKYPVKGQLPARNLSLQAEYQGCADMGVCYPPIRKTLQLTGSTGTPTTLLTTTGSSVNTPPTSSGAAPISEQDALTTKLASGNMLLTLLTFFGLGLLLAMTPCVFPMIPILSGIIISSSGEKTTTSKAFMLSLAYVLAMALTYTVVGVLAGLFGANLQVWFQNPWVLSIFAGVFVLLSLSMFGFYELQMPQGIQTKLTAISNRQEGGKLASAAIMGFLSALIVGPCVTAPLIAALTYIGQTGDAVLGGFALFFLSMGMGVPLLLIGASAGKLLPKAGVWMDTVKAVFGVLMLGVAIWLLERVLPTSISMALWALLLIISGIYMGVLQHLPETISGWRKLWKGFGYIAVLYGSLILIGVAGGSNNLFQPLKGLSSLANYEATAATTQALFQPIKGIDGLEQALASARSQNKPLMLDFYADWCVSCKEMEHLTFADPKVRQTLSQAILVQADVTANDSEDRALLKRFGIFGPPAILFFDHQGQERKPYRVVGFMSAEKFNNHAAQAFN